VTNAVVFAYSEVGVRCVRELLTQGIKIPLLFSHADDPKETQWFGSVQQLAESNGLKVVTPDSPNTAEWIAQGTELKPDFVFSFYYRYMLDKAWVELPRLGALNMHGSLLPKYRGRAPVHWAIIRGETVTGASLHYMVEKPDAGALVDQEAVPILENDTALEVSIKVADAAQTVLRRALPRLLAGTATPQPLDLKKGSYFGRRTPEDGRIDWRCGARAIHDLVRAVAPPYPGAFCEIGETRITLARTRLVDECPHGAPVQQGLFAAGDALFARAGDGRCLAVLAAQCDGRVLTAAALRLRAR